MLDTVLQVLTITTALGAGLIAGAFFAFSTFVMKALARLPVPQGIAAMQSINIVVINPLFLGPFLGTAIACIALAIMATLKWQSPTSPYLLAGSILYFAGTFLVTMRFNVPRNNALDKVDPATEDGATCWTQYLAEWTKWNHIRTIAALLSALSLVIAL
jgi:uncharacterized membrane protein